MAKKSTKLRKGTYCFRDVGTKKSKCVKANSPNSAVKKISKDLKNWEFISFKK